MTFKRLRVVKDKEFGGLGLKFVEPRKLCNGRFTIQSGLVLAHDIIEHQQGTHKIGTIGDEMIALGGTCYARAQWGSISAQDISADILNMSELFFAQKIPFKQKLVKSRNSDPTGFIDEVIETVKEEWNPHHHYTDDSCSELNQESIDTFLEACRTYMLHGAKLADRRFGSRMLAYDIFQDIETKTHDIINGCLEGEGQEFILFYDFNGNVRLDEVQGNLY